MDTLQNFEKAKISHSKLSGYALNPDHSDGKHKARRFMSALGFGQKDAEEIERQIRALLPRCKAINGVVDKHGKRYAVDIPMSGKNGDAIVRTAWIIGDDAVPRLTSIYVKESGYEL